MSFCLKQPNFECDTYQNYDITLKLENQEDNISLVYTKFDLII